MDLQEEMKRYRNKSNFLQQASRLMLCRKSQRENCTP